MQECKYDVYKNTSPPLLDHEILGDARCKLAIFLLGLLGGFTQKQITQALPKAKNNTILKTGSSTHRHRSEPYELLTTLSSGDILRRSWLSGREGRLLKVEDLKAQHHDRGSLR